MQVKIAVCYTYSHCCYEKMCTIHSVPSSPADAVGVKVFPNDAVGIQVKYWCVLHILPLLLWENV